jgi:hypothetical protein
MACEDLILNQPINTGCETVKMDFEAEAWHLPESLVTAITKDKIAAKVSAMTITGSPGAGNKVFMRGQKPYEGTGVAGEEKPYGVAFNETVQITIYGNTPTAASNVNKLSHGKHLFLLMQKGHDWQSRYVLYGAESGLMATAPALEPYGDAGGWTVPMASMNNES